MRQKFRADEPQQVSDKETEILLQIAREAILNVGDYVEMGCYRGDTSLLLQKMLVSEAPGKRLWIYDSFAGLPKRVSEDSSVAGDAFSAGKLYVTKREVVEKFKRAGVRLPIIRKGVFEELDAEADFPKEIAFAFLDGDLYTSIRSSLRLVGPKMVENGVIVVHDYNNPQLPGVSRAVEEWLAAHKNKRLTVRETLAIVR